MGLLREHASSADELRTRSTARQMALIGFDVDSPILSLAAHRGLNRAIPCKRVATASPKLSVDPNGKPFRAPPHHHLARPPGPGRLHRGAQRSAVSTHTKTQK